MKFDLNEDLAKRLLNFLDTKQYERLQFEVDMMGEIHDQHPLIIFYYASSIYLKEVSKKKDLIYASSLFEKVYLMKKTNLQPLYNMMVISFKTNEYKKVLKFATEAYKNNKKDTILIEGLARVNFYLGNRIESLKLFKSLFEILPKKTEGRFPFVASLNYSSGVTQEQYMSECIKFTKLIEKKLNVEKDEFKFDSKKNTKMKIHFLSADFKKHSVAFFMKDLMQKIDKSTFEVSLISNLNVIDHDDLTVELKQLADHWYDVEKMSDEELVIFLRSLNIDFLIDLSGFTQGNRLEVIARRCAKKQIIWLGYNNSLCLKNVDYLIADKNLIKSNEHNLYKEKILYMPKIWNSLSVPDKLPDIDNDKFRKNKFTFCSFNNFHKLSDRTIETWSKILNYKNTEIVLKDSLQGGKDLEENVVNKFVRNGVNIEQIIILDNQETIYDHLKLYNKVNLALDTFPYPGVTTSCEALLMGVPVLTMKGFNANSRCGESIIKNINMEEMIADDELDYVSKAISIMNDKNFEKKSGIYLRKKALSSPLFDTNSFANDFSSLIKEVSKHN